MLSRRGRAVALILAIVLVAVVGGIFWRIKSSARHDVSVERIAIDVPEAAPGLRGRGLKGQYRVDGIDFAGRQVGSRMPGELIVDWYADSGLSLHQEVWKMNGPSGAWWAFRSESPKARFERDASGLVADARPPAGLHADSYIYFCGNIGRSKKSEFEDCQVWGYWARYGQYLIYLELAGAREPKSSMDQIVAFFDDRVEFVTNR